MRVLGIDYGERRIGLAVSDATGTLASPLRTVPGSRDAGTAAAAVLRVLAEFAAADDPIAAIVVGLPTRLDGSANDQTPRARAFAAALARKAGCPVVEQDERLTSHEADQLLAEREPDWRARKARLDAAAAAVILQEYLDRQKEVEDRRQKTEDKDNG